MMSALFARRDRLALRGSWRSVAISFAVLGFAAGSVSAQNGATSASASPTAAATTSVGPQFSLATMSQQAETAAAHLRAISEPLASDAQVAGFEHQVAEYRHRVGERWANMDQSFRDSVRRGSIEAIVSSWQSLQIEVRALQAVVTERGKAREGDLQTLDRMRAWWSATRDSARQVGAPETVTARIDATLAAIKTAHDDVEQRSARLLVLQDSLSSLLQASDDALIRLEDARQHAVAAVFFQHEGPIWKIARTLDYSNQERLDRISEELGLRARSLIVYFEAYRAGFVVTALCFLAASIVLWRLRTHIAKSEDGRGALTGSVELILRAPLISAFILSLFFTRPLRPLAPLTLNQILLLVSMSMTMVLLKPLFTQGMRRLLYALVVLIGLDFTRQLLLATPGLEQILLLFEMTAALVIFTRIAAQLSRGDNGPTGDSRLQAAESRVFRFARVPVAAALLAGVLGYLELADLLGGAAVSLVGLGIPLLGLRFAVGGALGLLLAHTRLAQLRTVQARGSRAQSLVAGALDFFLIGYWTYTALALFELLAPTQNLVTSVLNADLQVGAVDFSVSGVLTFLGVAVGGWLASRFILFALEEDVYPRLELTRGASYALSSIIHYGLLLGVFFLALATLGLDLTRLTVLVSAFGVGIGFGMQEIVNNFVSGLILLFEHPVHVGDSVQLGDLSGEMRRIGIRSSTIRTGDGADVIVPNSKLIEDRVTNWTLSDRKRRVDLPVHVAAGVDAQQMLTLLVEVAGNDPRVMKTPGPEALLIALGGGDVEFQLRVWTEEPRWVRLRSDLGVAIKEAMRAAHMEGA